MAQDHIADHELPGSLFSLDAADNAEVIPTDLPRGPESMWSTDANPDEAMEVGGDRSALPPPPPGWSASPPGGSSQGGPPPGPSAGHGGAADDEAWSRLGSPTPPGSAGPRFDVGAPSDAGATRMAPTAAGAPGAGGVFSAEPVERDDDVLDEDEVLGELDEDWPEPAVPPTGSASLFSSGPANGAGAAVNGAASRAAAPGANPGATPAAGHEPTNPFTASSDPWRSWQEPDPEPAAAATSPTPPPFPGAARVDAATAEAVAADPHGYELAVSRLRAEDRERARVPLAVCGALLQPGEQVIGVVTGQMLGRPAAVAVTRTRVVVANDRRWIPIVDVYRVDEHLMVRGRHDRHVAALSFADQERFSMVDGITEVDLAIGLAAAIREPGQAASGGGSAF